MGEGGFWANVSAAAFLVRVYYVHGRRVYAGLRHGLSLGNRHEDGSWNGNGDSVESRGLFWYWVSWYVVADYFQRFGLVEKADSDWRQFITSIVLC